MNNGVGVLDTHPISCEVVLHDIHDCFIGGGSPNCDSFGPLRQQRTFRRHLLYGSRRHIREERAESLRHRRVRENGVAES